MAKAIIIGASSGIGRALAKEMDGDYELGLVARRVEMLEELKNELSSSTIIKKIDVCKTKEAKEILSSLIKEMDGVDIIVINAGVAFENFDVQWDKEKATIDTNVTGFTAISNTAYNYFLKKGSGHIVGISSIAALVGNPGAPAYNASKAFVSNYLQGLRLNAYKRKLPITVTDIKPGFVKTPLTEKNKKMFWVASAKKAAEQIYDAIQKKKAHAYITKRWRLIAWLIKILPECLYRFLIK